MTFLRIARQPHTYPQWVACLTLALLVAPLFAALDHPVHESEHASPIHTEAAHPDAAPHLDREEHHALEDCLVCVHGARLVVAELGTDWEPAVHHTDRPEAAVTAPAAPAHAPRRSRAPPA